MSIGCQLRAGTLARARQLPARTGPRIRAARCLGTDTTWPTMAAADPPATAHPRIRRKPGTRKPEPLWPPRRSQRDSGLNLPLTCANRYAHHEKVLIVGGLAAPPARVLSAQAALPNSPQDRSTGHEGLLMIGANRAAATGRLEYAQTGLSARGHSPGRTAYQPLAIGDPALCLLGRSAKPAWPSVMPPALTGCTPNLRDL
jgi:hypothetical protein